MRRALAVAVLFAGCTSTEPEPTQHYLSIGVDAIATTKGEVLEIVDDVAVVAFDGDLDELSHAMHENHHRCGGYMVHDSLDEARAALHMQGDPSLVALDYTLDRAAAVREVLPDLDASKILGTIRELSAMQNRYYRSESGAAASTWLRDRWRSFTTRTDVTVELFDHGYPQKSVILTIPGSTRPGEVIVLGGHLDSISLGGLGSVAPGADDDASGIATLTEVGRALLANHFRPARTVKLIAYAAEEVGLRGSLSIVKDYKKRNVNVVGVMQLDMTNYHGSDKDIWLIKDFTNAAQNTFLTTLIDTYVGATYGFDVCGYACSDHASWHRAGIPASMPFESRSNQRNQKIHTPQDTLETSGNNAAHAVKFARLAAAYAIELGKGELGPPEMTMDRTTTAAIATPASERSIPWTKLALVLSLGLSLLLSSRLGRHQL